MLTRTSHAGGGRVWGGEGRSITPFTAGVRNPALILAKNHPGIHCLRLSPHPINPGMIGANLNNRSHLKEARAIAFEER